MAEISKAETVKTDPRREWLLWIGLLLPPVAWAVQMEALYLTSDYGCAMMNFLWNHVAAASGLVLSLIGLAVSWSEWGRLGRASDDEGGTPVSRKRFMTVLGLLTGVLFSVLIAAQWLPTIMGVPCGK